MSGNGDTGGGVSGEEAAWRDLIARFDLPVDRLADEAPWPAREDLAEPAHELPLPERDSAVGRDQSGLAGRPGAAGIGPASIGPAGVSPLRASPQDPALGGSGRHEAGADGTDAALTDAALTDAALPGPALPGPAHAGPARTGPAALSGEPAAAGDAEDAGAPGNAVVPPETAAGAGGRHAAVNGGPRYRARIVRPADSIPRPPRADEDEDDSRYVPPPAEPLQLDPVAKGAWAGLLGGPGYLLVATLASWQVPDWGALAAIIAFVAGFAVLVLRMGDRPRDDDDNGAVV